MEEKADLQNLKTKEPGPHHDALYDVKMKHTTFHQSKANSIILGSDNVLKDHHGTRILLIQSYLLTSVRRIFFP